MSVIVVGVTPRDNVCLSSINTGLLVVLYIDMVLFFMEASVGGGQLVDLLDSIRRSWFVRLVFTDNWSPGSSIFLALMEMSGYCGFVCCCVVVLVAVCCVLTSGTWSLDNNLVGEVCCVY